MTCQELRARSDAYDPGDAAAFEAHLATCSACEAALFASAGPPSEIAGLSRSIEPSADLWPAIRERMAARRGQSARFAPPPTAATTAPVSSRIGAAMQTMPSSLSSFSTAQPRWRTAASALRNLSALVMVLGVRGASPAATTSSITGCGWNARMACPSAVQCAGLRTPRSERMRIACVLSRL